MRHFLPLALHLVSLLFTIRCSKTASAAASLAILGRGLAMRCCLVAAGNASARRPEITCFSLSARRRGMPARQG
jgi:hypothetical protein